MIRVVLIVLLAIALFAISMPALDDARTGITIDRMETEGDRIERAAGSVVADSMAVDERALAARSSLVVGPPTGFAAAPVERFALVDAERVDGVDDGHRVGASERTWIGLNAGVDFDADVMLAYRLQGAPTRTVPLSNPEGVGSLDIVGGRVDLRTDGESRLELRFVDGGDGPTVRIQRTG